MNCHIVLDCFLLGLICCSTLRRWRGGQQIEVWEAHKAAIQAVIKLPSGELVTGNVSSVALFLL